MPQERISLKTWNKCNHNLTSQKLLMHQFTVSYNSFSKVISNSISDTFDSNHPREEAWFGSGLLTVDYVQLKLIYKKMNIENHSFSFIDYERPLTLENVAV